PSWGVLGTGGHLPAAASGTVSGAENERPGGTTQGISRDGKGCRGFQGRTRGNKHGRGGGWIWAAICPGRIRGDMGAPGGAPPARGSARGATCCYDPLSRDVSCYEIATTARPSAAVW